MKKEKETWVTVNGFSKYSVSNRGKIMNKMTGVILKGSLNYSGYLKVGLLDDENNYKWRLIHRIVAETFVPNLTEGEEVDHIDGNKTNNSSENLRWVTSKENKHFIPREKRRKQRVIRRIKQYTMDGEFVKEYENATSTGYCPVCILWCCKGRTKQAYGYLWRFSEDK